MAHALNLIKPLAVRLREEAERNVANPEWVSENTATLDELAGFWGMSYDAARLRVNRAGMRALDVPREDGRTIKRVFLSDLSVRDRKLLLRERRKTALAASGAPAHHGGLVVDEQGDARVKVRQDVKELIAALYCRREAPGVDWVFEQLCAKCPFCEQSEMKPVRRDFAGRYGSRRCPACDMSISYRTVHRIVNDPKVIPNEIKVATREGWNAAVNKFQYKAKIPRGIYRNHILVGDHHRLDLWCYDPRHKFTDGGKPRYVRLWLSAWQDEATGVVGWALGEQPNVRLMMEAMYRYALKFGLPVEIRTDNGKDYLSEEFQRFYSGVGIEDHHKSIPSCRTGESHGKSKVIERWFGTFERDLMKFMPGWCGSHPKERPDDILWPMCKAHEEFLQGEKRETPFLTVDEVETRIQQWVDGVFHQAPQRRTDCSPLDAWQRDTREVRTLGERALRIHLLQSNQRRIGANGVSVNGVNYWNPQFIGIKGEVVDVRIDPKDISEAVVVVQLPGKQAYVLIALAPNEVQGGSEELARVKQINKAERQLQKDFHAMQRRRLEGRSTWDQVLEEKARRAGTPENDEPVRQVVNAVPQITEGHHVANAIEKAVRPARTAQEALVPERPSLISMDSIFRRESEDAPIDFVPGELKGWFEDEK